MSFVSEDRRQFAPATQRNRAPILAILKSILPASGTVLEIASGTGEHAVFFAAQLPHLHWLPTDIRPEARSSLRAWRAATGVTTVYEPVALDVCAQPWSIETPEIQATAPWQLTEIGAIAAINLLHISPWAACSGLMSGAARVLPVGGVLYVYGPFFQSDVTTAPSNVAFDQLLQAENPEWGIRHLDAVSAIAQQHQLPLKQIINMPANNLSLIFEKI